MHAYINGEEISFEANETILEAARRGGHYIPTLCELADIDHTPGTCRVCLVEIKQDGSKDDTRVVTSCDTPMMEGMEVFTRTRQVREMQRLQVELLLADHDQECATCIRHGSCEVQDVAQFVGLQRSRYFEPQNAEREVDATAPGFARDMGKCIRCYRCVKICRDYQGVDALVMTGRGTDAGVGLRPGLTQGSSECVSCGQCVLVCPTGALGEKDETETVVDYLYDPEIVTVFQFAPAIRVGFGEEFGLAPGTNVEGQIISAIRSIGADIVLDTNFAADIVIMEEGTELLKKYGEGRRQLFTSCCPAWINFAEKHYPEILPHLSSTRSPQQCFGSIAKTYLPEKMGVDAAKVRVVSIMPCIAKKDEAGRAMYQNDGVLDVDVVLTIREFARLLRREGIDLKNLEPSTFDNPYMGGYSGAGAIFATTGGVMEAAVRTMYQAVNGKELEEVEIEALRGFEGVRSAVVDLGGDIGEVKLALCHGLKGVRKVVEDVLAGKSDFDFIEVMACPGGCVDGGGHLRSKKAYLPHALKRRDTLYAIDKQSTYRQSHNNPMVQKLYEDFLERPLSSKSHDLLHTHYIARKKHMRQTIRDIWKDITMSTLVHSEFDNASQTASCKGDIE